MFANTAPTWLCWLSWLLKVTVRFPAAALGTALVEYRDLLLSYVLRRLQISMFWKHDLTLVKNKIKSLSAVILAAKAFIFICFVKKKKKLSTLTVSCADNLSGGSLWRKDDPRFLWGWSFCRHPDEAFVSTDLWTPFCPLSQPACPSPPDETTGWPGTQKATTLSESRRICDEPS